MILWPTAYQNLKELNLGILVAHTDLKCHLQPPIIRVHSTSPSRFLSSPSPQTSLHRSPSPSTTTRVTPSMSSPSFTNPYLPLLHSSSTPIFLLGAGISTSLGIPDFRSSEGLYATLKLEEYGLNAAEDLFDYEHFCGERIAPRIWSVRATRY